MINPRRKGLTDSSINFKIKQIMSEQTVNQKKDVHLRFRGIDNLDRIVFKDVNRQAFYGCLNHLFPDNKRFPNGSVEDIKNYFREHLDEIEYFGNHFNCEPYGGVDNNINFIID